MARLKAFVVAVLVAATAVAGAAAAMQFVRLGPSPVRPALAPASALAGRQAKLDRLSAALDRARRARPPKLPAKPRFPHVVIPEPVSLAPVAPTQPVSNRTPPTTPAPSAPVRQPVTPQPAPPTVTTVVVAPPPATTTGQSDDGQADNGDGGGGGGGDD
jgi:hypothetical protein